MARLSSSWKRLTGFAIDEGEARGDWHVDWDTFHRTHEPHVRTGKQVEAFDAFIELQRNIAQLHERFISTKTRPIRREDKGVSAPVAGGCAAEVESKDLLDFLASLVDALRGAKEALEFLHDEGYIEVECKDLQVNGPFHWMIRDADLLSPGVPVILKMDGGRFDSITLDCETDLTQFLSRDLPKGLFERKFMEISIAKANCAGALRVVGPNWRIFAEGVAAGSMHVDRAIGSISAPGATITGATTVYRSKLHSIGLARATLTGGFHAQQCWFLSSMNLDAAKITNRLHFVHCLFFQLPSVHEAAIPTDFTFVASRFFAELGRRRKTRIMRQGNLENGVKFHMNIRPDFFSSTPSSTASDLARALRLAMRKAGAHEEEGRFFALEMRSRRQSKVRDDSGGVDRVISWLYDVVSIYGTSPSRALATLAIWNLAFGVLFALLRVIGDLTSIPVGFGYSFGIPSGSLKALGTAFDRIEPIGLALQNSINPLAILSSSAAVQTTNVSVALLSVAQGLGSIGVGALLLLALRNKFQRGGGGS